MAIHVLKNAGFISNFDTQFPNPFETHLLTEIVVAINAMLLKEQFLAIYSSKDRKSAFTSIREWIVVAIKSKIPSFEELGLKFFRKRHYILNYFIYNIISTISEGINDKIKRLKRMAYGYKILIAQNPPALWITESKVFNLNLKEG